MSEQLHLLGLEPTAPPLRASGPRSERRALTSVRGDRRSAALALDEALVELRFPEALDFLREHGPDAVAVLHLLAVDARLTDGQLVVTASTRGVAERLGFLSKDTAHRRLRQLRRAGVLEVLPSTGPSALPSYELHLDGTGITVTDPSR